MTRLLGWYARVRQWTYPRDFRIAVDRGKGVPDSSLMIMVELLEQSGRRRESSEKVGRQPTIDPGFIIKLCNEHASARRSARQMAPTSRESDDINLALKRVDRLLRAHHVECLDLEGEEYTPARDDFEPIGEPESVPGIERMTIGFCERPKVVVEGRLIQRARGILQKPT